MIHALYIHHTWSHICWRMCLKLIGSLKCVMIFMEMWIQVVIGLYISLPRIWPSGLLWSLASICWVFPKKDLHPFSFWNRGFWRLLSRHLNMIFPGAYILLS
jgi:hypothetical protein